MTEPLSTEGLAEALREAAEAVLSGEHRWQGGYFCECGHEVNSAAGWFAHVATARTDAIQEGRADV